MWIFHAIHTATCSASVLCRETSQQAIPIPSISLHKQCLCYDCANKVQVLRDTPVLSPEKLNSGSISQQQQHHQCSLKATLQWVSTIPPTTESRSEGHHCHRAEMACWHTDHQDSEDNWLCLSSNFPFNVLKEFKHLPTKGRSDTLLSSQQVMNGGVPGSLDEA